MMVEHNQSKYYKVPYPTTNTGTYDNKWKFNGKELDDATGMYYYGARYYDPRISIFVSVDPLVEKYPGWTPYHYVHNNPINLIDPTGMSAEPPTTYENEETGEKVTVQDGIDRTLKVDEKDFKKAKEFAKLGKIERGNKKWTFDKFYEYKGFYEDIRYGSTIGEKLSTLGSYFISNFLESELQDPNMDYGVIEDFGLLSGGAGAVKNTPKLIKAIDKLGDYNVARNAALNWLTARGFKAEKLVMGKFGTSKGKPIGMSSMDGKMGFRVEYDARSGAHINVWFGKEKGPHFRFQASEKTVNEIIKRFSR